MGHYQQEESEARRRVFTIRLQHVSPQVMAFWLNPENNAAPPELGVSSGLPSPLPKGGLGLPEGIDRMVPIDPQNSLLVFGTEAGVKELRDIIAVLNRPLRQIEVEARLILIQSANLTGIWADLAAQADNNRPAMGFFDSDTEKQVTEMLVRNQAKILASRRRNSIDNATQGFSFGSPIFDGYLSPRLTIPNRAPDEFSSLMPVIPPPKGMTQMPSLGRVTPQLPSATAPFDRLSLQVTPTITDNGSVTLEFKTAGLSTRNLEGNATLRDGQTLGIPLPIVAGASGRAFLLLTPRIARRAETHNAIPD